MCTAEIEMHTERAQSACGQLMLSLEQPRFSHLELTHGREAQDWQPQQ